MRTSSRLASSISSLSLLPIAFIVALAACGDGATPAGPDAAPCPAGFTLCGSTCVDVSSDNAHCGACNAACEAGNVCNGAGTCELSCQSGLTDCNGTCVDTRSDRNHCGGCESACDAGFVCDGAGTCELSCQAGLLECGGTCIDPGSDRTFCGANGDCAGANAGTTCAAGEVCNGSGACELSCQSGLLDCNGTCIDPDADLTFCGASGDCAGANAGTTCAAGEVCNGAGSCELSCQSGLLDCNGTCIDPGSNPDFCGASLDCAGANAGTDCAADEACNAGTCTSLFIPRSCAEILGAGASTGDGVYTIDLDGIGPIPETQVFCDMTTSGGGWTQCLSFVNTAAEDVNNNTWFDDCIDFTMAAATGTSLLVRLRDATGTAVYTTTGTRTVDWTQDHVTSTAATGAQFDLNQHARKVTLANGDLLVIPGRSANNAGCHGSLGNGYGVLIYPTGSTDLAAPKMLVLPYRQQIGSNAPRPLGQSNAQWFENNEISFGGGSTFNTCGFPPAHLGTFEVFVR